MFSLILFIVFSWAIFRMLFQIPSWIMSHSKSGIFFLASYVFSFALLESVLLFTFLLLICFILPQRIFRERFVAQGSLVILACTAWALFLQFQGEALTKIGLSELTTWIIVFFLSLLLITLVSYFLFKKYNRIQSALEALADRMTVFAWIYVPVGLVSITIVIIRNIV